MEIELSEREKILEVASCGASFLYFLKYVKIVEPPTQEKMGGVIELELWEHLKTFVRVLVGAKLIALLKARQVGASWIIAAYALWYGMFKMGATVMLFSKGEIEAQELLGKARRIYNNLPEWMRIKVDPDSATEMGFKGQVSSIKAFAATETAGISFTASLVVCDEWDEHPYADENFLASKPTRDAGGQFVGVFTASKLKPGTLAKAVYREALEGKNDFVPLFFGWDVRPGRDRVWYEATKRNIPQRELAKLTPELYMEQNYPASVEEALRMTQSVLAFDVKALDEMAGETREPLELTEEGIDTNIIKVFQLYHVGESYIAASDTSHGVGRDYSVSVVMNARTGTVVADIISNQLSPEEFAYQTVKLLGLFRNPLWFPEDNEWGRVLITIAQRLGYKAFGYQDKERQRPGFHTGDSNRYDLWGGLIPAIKNHQITIYNIEGLRQFYDVIRNVEREGRIEAAPGKHDDYPVAVGIAWLKRAEAVHDRVELKPIETLHFAGQEKHWIRAVLAGGRE